MRPIKFRAWDKNTDTMTNVKTLDFEADGSVGCAVDSSGISGDIDGEWTLEQYTGLKDDSDKEIYEGDIIKAEAENDDGSVDGMIGKVSYDNHTASFVLIPLDNDKEMWSFDNLFDEGFCELFCIGNIHEKPELLEDK